MTQNLSFPKTEEAGVALIKFVATANAGGVAATITMIGASAMNGGFERILALPLAAFAFGVCFTIMYPLSHFLRIAKIEGFEPTPPKPLIHDNFLRFSGYAAIGCFILGCLFGVGIVACA